MRWLLLLTLLAVVSAVAPVFASDEQDCFQSQEPQRRIKGCSEIIKRAPKDATAYHNRGVAHELAGDLDKAIADYTMAIEIAPSNASAYENRGHAYASKGDYTRAVADQAKADEFIAKAAAQPTVITAKPSKPKRKAIRKAAKEAPNTSWWPWAGSAGTTDSKTKP
jgi:tetratricopeptide (TPR) repeat protein